MQSEELLEVRLLGGLQVVRPDGRIVHDREWRTRRSADLLRLLALSAEHPVPVPGILAKFWPDAEPSQGKTSLRTALAELRRVVGKAHVVRTTAGLTLTGAWVDVSAYRMLAAQAGAAARGGRHADLIRLARESEGLYTADFGAADDEAAWVIGTRRGLVELRKRLLSDAAEAAVELRWFRDGIHFAETAIGLDQALERACRALMRSYAGVGETGQALQAFEACRRHLADRLGADPSPLTAAVHVQILSGPALSFSEQQLVGRDAAIDALTDHLTSGLSARVSSLVRVVGEPGSGRDSVIDRSLREIGGYARSRVVVSSCEAELLRERSTLYAAVAPSPGGDGRAAPTAVLVTKAAGPLPGALAELAERGDLRVREVRLGALATPDLTVLAEQVLAGQTSPALVSRLEEASAGQPGAAVRELRRWSARGSVVWTSAGLEVVASDVGWEGEHSFGRVLRELQSRMPSDQVELMQTVALLNRPVTVDEVAAVARDASGPADRLSGDRDRVQSLLDRLSHIGALRAGHRGYEFRHPGLRDATLEWTRASTRRELERRLRDHGRQKTEERRPA